MASRRFPIVIVVKRNTTLIIDYIKDSCIPTLFRITQIHSSSSDTGISPSDFPSEENFRHMIKACPMGVQYTLEATGVCVGFTAMFPSEMCRSSRPISARGFTVLDPEVQNMGLGQSGPRYGRPWAKELGIPGHIARSSLTNTLGLMFARKSDLIFQGWIPDSYQDIDGKWHDELVTTGEFSEAPEVYKMTNDEVIAKCVTDPLELVYTKIPFKGLDMSRNVTLPHIGKCIMQTTKEEDCESVYHTLIQAAVYGECFGIDEFPSNIIFQNYFLKERKVVQLIKDSDIVGLDM